MPLRTHVPLALTLAAAALAAAPLACRPTTGSNSARRPPVGHGESGDAAAHRVATIEGFLQPESVKYDAEQDVWFVTNMLGYGSAKDGAGYIVRLNGSDLSRMDILVQGGKNGATLDAPKGMALHGDTLWVTDIDVLRGFDRKSGRPLATVDLRPHHAVLLNDVAVGPDGSLHVTDSGIIMSDKGVLHPGGDKVFVVGPGRSVSVVANGDQLGRPNGITWDLEGKRWIIVSFDPFHSEVYAIGADSTKRTVLASGKGKFDGVELLPDGRILVTGWNDSSVHLFADGRDDRIVRNLSQPADLGLDPRRRRIAIPLVTLGRVEFWDLPDSSSAGD